MPHNIFILTKVEVHAPVPLIIQDKKKKKKKKPELAGMCYHLMKINRVHSIVPCLGSFVNLLN